MDRLIFAILRGILAWLILEINKPRGILGLFSQQLSFKNFYNYNKFCDDREMHFLKDKQWTSNKPAQITATRAEKLMMYVL